MELMRIRQRLRAHMRRAYWLARYSYWDTPRGLQLRIGGALLGLMALVALGATAFVAWQTPTAAHTQHAVVVAIIALIVAIVAAILAVVMAPKPKSQKPRGADSPSTDDGQGVPDHFGSVWVDDSFILAWKQMGTVPIKGKSK